MKKILLVVLITSLGLFICCDAPNPIKVRNVEGTIISISKAEFNNFNGIFITWQKFRRPVELLEDNPPRQIWFIYPFQEFPKVPFKL